MSGSNLISHYYVTHLELLRNTFYSHTAVVEECKTITIMKSVSLNPSSYLSQTERQKPIYSLVLSMIHDNTASRDLEVMVLIMYPL